MRDRELRCPFKIHKTLAQEDSSQVSEKKISMNLETFERLRNNSTQTSFDLNNLKNSYRIFANSFHGNYSFLNLTLCTVIKGHCT